MNKNSVKRGTCDRILENLGWWLWAVYRPNHAQLRTFTGDWTCTNDVSVKFTQIYSHNVHDISLVNVQYFVIHQIWFITQMFLLVWAIMMSLYAELFVPKTFRLRRSKRKISLFNKINCAAVTGLLGSFLAIFSHRAEQTDLNDLWNLLKKRCTRSLTNKSQSNYLRK